MKKKFGLACVLLVTANVAYAQIGMNTPNPKSTLDITAKNPNGTTKIPEGLLIPRVDRQRAQSMDNIIASTMIYVDNVSTGSATGKSVNINATGFYFFDGTVWVKMKSESTAAIYDADGILKSDRTVAHGDKKLKFTGTTVNTFSVDGNTFSVDAANKRIGLGTAIPQNKLDLGSDAAKDATDEAGKKLAVYNSPNGNSFYGLGVNGYTLQLHAASAKNDAPQMVLKNTGNVGIGTVEPQNRLDLGTITGGTDDTAVAGKKLAVYNNATGSQFYGLGVSSQKLQFHAAANKTSAPGMVLTGAGNVGIGTTNPESRLHINGSLRIENGEQANNRVLTSDANGVATWKDLPANIDTSLYNANGSISANRTVAQTDKTLAFTGTATNAFSVDGTTFSVDAKNDRIGAGTAAPKAKVDIVGNGAVLGIRNAENSGSWDNLWFKVDGSSPTINASGAEGGLQFNVGKNTVGTYGDGQTLTTVATMLADGNMGIGTTTPTNKLDVRSATAGALKIVDGTQGNNKVLTSNADGVATWKDLPTNTDTSLYNSNGTISANRTVAQADKTLAFTGTSTNAFSVDGDTFSVDAANDRIGIGTTTPFAKLDIVADNKVNSTEKEVFLRGFGRSKTPIIHIGSANGTLAAPTNLVNNEDIGGINFTPRAGNNFAWGAGSGFSAKYKGNGTTNLTDLTLKTSGEERMRIDENGNIGVGTSAPSAKLHINGSLRIENGEQANNRVLTSDANGVATWKDLPATTDTSIYKADGALAGNRTVDQGANKLAFTTTATNGFSVDDTTFSVDAKNDRVGIGTTTPENNLHVVSKENKNGRYSLIDAPSSTGHSPILTLRNTSPLATNNHTLLGFSNNGTSAAGATWQLGSVRTGDTITSGSEEDFMIGSYPGRGSLVEERIRITSDGRIGIGTSVPSSKLHINGSVRIADGSQANNKVLTSDANGVATWKDLPAATDTNLYNANGTINADRTVTQGNKKLTFTSTVTNGFSVDGDTFSVDAANDRIGIGTTTPFAKLDIVADNKVNSTEKEMFLRGFGRSKTPIIHISSANGTLAAPTNLVNNEDIGGINFTPRAGNNFAWGAGSGVSAKYKGNGTTNLTDLTLKTSGDERMRIDENGNIGVGTSAPSAKLHINGSLRIENGEQANNRVLTSDANGVATWKDLPATTNTSIYNTNGTIAGHRTVAQGANRLEFTGTAANAFSVDGTTFSVDAANNRIGLGTTAPIAKLEMLASGETGAVKNEIRLSGHGATKNSDIIITSANGTASKPENSVKGDLIGGISFIPRLGSYYLHGSGAHITSKVGTGAGADIRFSTASANDLRMIVTETGNIGIGTEEPSHKLHVAGSVKIANGSQANNRVLTSDANGVATWKDLPATTDTSIYKADGTIAGNRTVAQGANRLAFTGSSTNAFSVDGNTFSVDAANDRIGLGTTAPFSKLDIVADDKVNSTEKEVFLRGFGRSKTPIIHIGSANGTLAAPTNLVNNEDIGSINFTPRAGNNFAWGAGTGISAKYKGNGTTNLTDLTLKTSGDERMRIDENGNIGVGTSAPSAKLHINGSLRIENGGQANNRVLTSDANGVATWKDLPASTDTSLYNANGTISSNRIVAQADKTLAFTGNTTNSFSVDGATFSVDAANDRIGLGTTAPTHKLDVRGAVKIADGTQGAGKVLTSDANGVASWQLVRDQSRWEFNDFYDITSPTTVTHNVTSIGKVNNIDLKMSITVTIPARSEAKITTSYSIPAGTTTGTAAENYRGYVGVRFLKNGSEFVPGSRKYSVPVIGGTHSRMVSIGNSLGDTITNTSYSPMTVTYSLNGYIETVNPSSTNVLFYFNSWSTSGQNYNWGKGYMKAELYTKSL
ncbi:beta strand repeat-containing protein [Chryseobacterium polytrichastri]|uniref:Uncharacterized protein n=1 Tax=Chryseobacterium polytrichastri TaxID=1302687 RepID=A0A1M6PIP7_9FLAO|nr:hypothetical protein [Chryseobacterium polytrichastri]SHK07793.1 hypothetical protein SAMN05444267_100120 [Chryseobacterium polytrichastri]